MRLIKIVKADSRDPRVPEQHAENVVNEALQILQNNDDGKRNINIQVLDVKEKTKDSGISHFLITYEDKGLDILK